MKDMIPKGTGNSRFMKSNIPANITHDELVTLLRTGMFPYDIGSINPSGIAAQGTPLNKASFLRDETAAAFFGGGVADKTVDDVLQQLKAAPFERFPNLVYQEWTESTVWTAPDDVAGPCQILCCGGGGGGGGMFSYYRSAQYPGGSASTSYAYGGGGGGGYISIVSATIVPGATYEIIIGNGGTGGIGGSSNDGTLALVGTPATKGGTSSFGTLCSAAGGDPGGTPTAISDFAHIYGGNGGAGGGGGCISSGSNGSGSVSRSGNGGNSQFGGGGGCYITGNVAFDGTPGTPGTYGKLSPDRTPITTAIPLIILPPITVLLMNGSLEVPQSASNSNGAGGGGLGSYGFGANGIGGGGGGFFSCGHISGAASRPTLINYAGGGGYVSAIINNAHTRGGGGTVNQNVTQANKVANGASGVVAIWYYKKS